MATMRCEDCNAVLVGGSCVICGWTPRPTARRRPQSQLELPRSPEELSAGRARVREILDRFSRPTATSPDDPVSYHAKRFQARGLSEGGAYMQARALVEDRDHAETCAVCQAAPEAGRALRQHTEQMQRLYAGGIPLVSEVVKNLHSIRRR